jgi:hypothetical protein
MFKKGNVPWIKGKHHLEETKRKIGIANSKALKGRKLSLERRIQASERMKKECQNPNSIYHSKERSKKIVETRRKNGSYVVSDGVKRKLSLANTGRKHTKEARKKISINNARYWKRKRFHHREETKKKMSITRTGKKVHTEKSRKKLSLIHKGKRLSPKTEFKKGHIGYKANLGKFGSMSPVFKGYPKGYGYEFSVIRKHSMKFYNYVCVQCGISNDVHKLLCGKELSVHHKDGNKKNNSIYNCVPLCANCHAKQKIHHHKDFEILSLDKFKGGNYGKINMGNIKYTG